MNVNTRLTPQQLSAPQQSAPKAEPKDATFSYNPQDPETLPNDTATISGVNANDGRPETDVVKLTPKKGLFFFGQLIALREDPNYKLTPDKDGNYVLPTSDEHFTGVQTMGAAAKTVNKFNEVMQEVAGKKIEWAFGENQLGVSPETGEWPNAFYARDQKGVHFFDVKNTSTGNSGEVVSHEVGHAILDALRPSFLGGTGPETGAFHEAFGDVVAMLMTLGNDGAVDKIVEQTGGDLSKNRNILSDMGEGFGQAIGRPEGGIRTSFNDFKYQDPATLPERGDDTHLGREVHDFSRLWSGAFYDTLDAIADANRAEGMSPKEALKAAGEEGFRLLVAQMQKAPQSSEATFKDMAKAMMQGDQEFNGGKRQDLIRDVMTKRDLLPQGEGLFKSLNFELSGNPVVKTTTLGPDFGVLNGVKMDSVVDQPVFSAFAAGSNALGDMATNAVTAEAQKGVKMMLQDGDILFTDNAKPGLDEIFRPDGTAFKAYVTTDDQGNRELHRIPMALCSFGDDHEQHGHVHA